MPRYNQSTIQQGQIVDPTAGLANLAQEAKSQDELNKQQRQRYAAVRQAIAVKGLMGKVGVKATQGGDIEITGADGGMSDSDAKKAYYQIGQEDDGIKGVGKTSTTTVDDSLMKQGIARQTQAIANDQAQSVPTQTAVASMVAGKVPELSGFNSTPFNVDKLIGAIMGRSEKAQVTADEAKADAATTEITQATPLSPEIMKQKNSAGTISTTTPIKVPMALAEDKNPAVNPTDPNVTGTEKLPEIPKLDKAKEGDGTTTGAILSHGPYQSELGQGMSVNAANVATNPAPVTAGGVSSSSSKSMSVGGSESKGSTVAVGYKGLHSAEGGNIGVSTTRENNDGGTIVDSVQMSRRDLMAAQLDSDSQSNAWGGQKTSVFDNAIAQKNAVNQAVNQALQSRFSTTKQEYTGTYNTAYSGASYDGSASKNMAQQNNISVGDRTTNSGGGKDDDSNYIIKGGDGNVKNIKVVNGIVQADINNTHGVEAQNLGLHKLGDIGSPQMLKAFDDKIANSKIELKGWRTASMPGSNKNENKIYFYAPGDKDGDPSMYLYRRGSSEDINKTGDVAHIKNEQGGALGGIFEFRVIKPTAQTAIELFSGTKAQKANISAKQ